MHSGVLFMIKKKVLWEEWYTAPVFRGQRRRAESRRTQTTQYGSKQTARFGPVDLFTPCGERLSAAARMNARLCRSLSS
jgi:hypothetical protein